MGWLSDSQEQGSQKFLLEEANGRVWLERIPGYSPDLNPDEGVWNYLKRVGLKNQVFSNLKELGKGLRKAIRHFAPIRI